MKNRIILYCKLTVSLPDYSYILVRLNTLASTTPTYKNKMYLKDDKLTDRGCCWYSKDHTAFHLRRLNRNNPLMKIKNFRQRKRFKQIDNRS